MCRAAHYSSTTMAQPSAPFFTSSSVAVLEMPCTMQGKRGALVCGSCQHQCGHQTQLKGLQCACQRPANLTTSHGQVAAHATAQSPSQPCISADPHQDFIVAGGGADAGHQLPLLRRGLHTVSRRQRCSRVVLAAAGSYAVCSCAKSKRQQHPGGQQTCRRQQGQCKQHVPCDCCKAQLSSSLPCGPHRAAARAAGCCCHWPLPAERVAAAGWGRCPCQRAPSRWAAHWLLHCCCAPQRRA